MKDVPKLYPNVSAENLTILRLPVSLQSCRSEQITPPCTSEKSSKPLRKDIGKLPELPSEPAPKKTCAPENNNTDTTENQRSQDIQCETMPVPQVPSKKEGLCFTNSGFVNAHTKSLSPTNFQRKKD